MINLEERRLFSMLCERVRGRMQGVLIFTFIAVWLTPIIIDLIPRHHNKEMYIAGGIAFLCVIIQVFVRDISLDKALKKEFDEGDIVLKKLVQDDKI